MKKIRNYFKNLKDNMKENKNSGFSLVELIVVIAIMAVLVGVIAPQFIKYVESSRRATDIQTAENIRESILADVADQVGIFENSQLDAEAIDASDALPTAIAEVPTVKGTDAEDNFFAAWNSAEGTCDVYVEVDGVKYLLTDSNSARDYKNQAEETEYTATVK